MNAKRDALEQLLRREPSIWRGWGAEHRSRPALPTGFPELDAALPEGGWPFGALLEIGVRCVGLGEMRLLLPAMAALSQVGRWIVWVAPPYRPYGPALAQAGVELGQVWVVEPRQAGDIPWSLEKLLRSGCCGMALAWPRRLADHQVRRLQLAAEAGGGLGVLIGQSAAGAGYAALRIEANPAPQGLAVDILKARGSLRRASVIVTP